MFGRKKSARRSLRAAILAGSTVVALGIGGLSASGAAAAPTCAGASILGEGASLQKVAHQNVLIPGFQGPGGPCEGKELVKYEGPGSSAGLKAWDFTGEKGTIDHTKAFVASDDAPTGVQIENAQKAAGPENNVLVIPVVQTAISIIVNPPVGCEVEEITNKQLESVFRGNVKKWGQIDTAFGAGCAGKTITRVVRPDGSGTTYQFKNYLYKINEEKLECTEGPKSWKELEPVGAGNKPNITWPEEGVGTCTGGATPIVTSAPATGGGNLVKKVNTTDGSIGYASLPDAEGNKEVGTTNTLRLQNNGLVKVAKATYAEPGTEALNANCAAAQYTVPVAARAEGGTGENVDWSQVFGANLSIGGEDYPLCTITYDMAWKNYGKAGFEEPTEVTVHDYLTEYVTASAGQKAIEKGKRFYTPLPGGANARNVLGAAQLAAGKIGF